MKNAVKYMAIDYGDARTGVAFSDASNTIAGETLVLHGDFLARCAALAKERGVTKIAVGYPLNMNGTAGERARMCAAFCRDLQRASGVECILWDERRTTIDAHRILSENGRRGKARRDIVDAVAACLILEGFMAAQN